jgi:tRNA 2-thiocytidine biosynthesis protein TtcA
MTDKTSIQLVSAGLLKKRLHFLVRRVKQAQRRFDLIEEGDRILVGLSGGKDSLTLLHALQGLQPEFNGSYELGALHVEIRQTAEREAKRELLAKHVSGLGLRPDFVEMDLPEDEKSLKPGRRCFLCSWRRRKSLFTFARKHGYNKLALAHHLDDAAETALMNLVFHAHLGTMEPKIEFFGGAVTLIRPFILAEEHEIRRVAKLLAFPFFECFCAEENQTKRDRAKDIIRSFGARSRTVKRNIWQAARTWLQATRFAGINGL